MAGHGVDPTGAVTDVVSFCCQVSSQFITFFLKAGQLFELIDIHLDSTQVAFAQPEDHQIQQSTEQTSTIKVIGKFNNKFLGRYHFIFKDGDACQLDQPAAQLGSKAIVADGQPAPQQGSKAMGDDGQPDPPAAQQGSKAMGDVCQLDPPAPQQGPKAMVDDGQLDPPAPQ